MDPWHEYKILWFSKEGTLRGAFDKLGRGPGEITMATDILYNKYTDNVEILDPRGEIYRYNPDSTLSFKNSVKIPDVIAVHEFAILQKGIYIIFSRSESPNLFIFYEDRNETKPIDYSIPKWLAFSSYFCNPFFYFENEVRFFESFTGSVYSIDASAGKLVPYLEIDTGKYHFDYNDLEPDHDTEYYSKVMHKMSHRYVTPFFEMTETNDYFFSNFIFSNKPFCIVINKHDSTAKIFKSTKEGILFLPRFCLPDGNVIDFFSPREKSAFYSIYSPILDDESKRILENLTDESNYSAIIYHLKH